MPRDLVNLEGEALRLADEVQRGKKVKVKGEHLLALRQFYRGLLDQKARGQFIMEKPQ